MLTQPKVWEIAALFREVPAALENFSCPLMETLEHENNESVDRTFLDFLFSLTFLSFVLFTVFFFEFFFVFLI